MVKIKSFAFAIVMIVISVACTSTVKENSLSKFADPKEEYAMLLHGYVAYESDTVFFDFIPAVQFSIDWDSDEIIVKRNDGAKAGFFRNMENMNAVPNPSGEGKFMTSWKSKIWQPYTMSDEEAMTVFNRVMLNGKIIYDGFENQEALRNNFVNTYQKTEAEADRLASEVSKPIFSSRKI